MAIPTSGDAAPGWKLGAGGEDTSRGPKFAHIGGGKQGNHPLLSNQTTQHYPLGYRWDTGDGRVFRYAYFQSAVAAGKLAAPDASLVNVTETAATTVRNAAGAAADIASSDTVTKLYFLDTDKFTAVNSDDILAGGFVHIVNSDTGGNTYKIRKNTYTGSTSVIEVELYDSIVGDISSESEVAVTGNMYTHLAIANNGVDDSVAGIPLVDAAATSYGWLQTWGTCCCLADETAGTIAAGTVAVLSDGVNGAVEPLNIAAINSEDDFALLNFAEPVCGFFMGDITDKNFCQLMLQLAP